MATSCSFSRAVLFKTIAATGVLGASAAWAQQAQPPASTTLPEVTVGADREAIDEAPPAYAGGQVSSGARLGIMGNTPVMDTPFSITGYTAETIQNEQARSVADLVAADPTVRMASARSNINEDITIRGFSVPTGDFALNGMFGLLPYWRAPLEIAERVEILKGPSAALFGMTPSGSIGGVVNVVPKRAGSESNASVTAGYMSDSVFGVSTDLGARFGVDKAFGVRVNAMTRKGDTNIDDQTTNESLGSLALDFRHRALRASLDLLWSKQRVDNVVRQYQLGPTLTAVPEVPENSIAYPQYGYTSGKDASALFKTEYDLTDSTTAFIGIGERDNKWDAVAGNPVIMNTAGDYSYFGGWQRQDVESKTMEAGIRQSFNTGPVHHKATLVYNRLDQSQQLGFYTGFPPGMGNMYVSRLLPTPSTVGISNPLRNYQDTTLSSYAVADTMSFLDDQLLLTLGARHQTVEGQTYNFATGAPSGPYYDQSATTPVAGIVYKLRPNISLYGSYVEGLSRGDTAPISAALTNPGEMLAPFKSKQTEIGAKFDTGTLLTTVAAFEITRPSSGVSGNTFGVFGEQRNRGLEGSVAGEIAKGVRMLGGLTYVNGELSESVTPALVGKKAIGVPEWQANLGAEWDPSFLPGLTLTGRVIYTDGAYANAMNTLEIPSWTRFDAGARYATRMANQGVTFRFNVENLFDKDYYGIATAGYLHIGTPRTFTASVTVDF